MRLILALFLGVAFQNASAQSSAIKLSPQELPQNFKNISQISINHKIITKSEIAERTSFVIKSSALNLSSRQFNNSWQKMVTERMIEEELIRQKAESYKIKIESSEIDNYIENYALRYYKNIDHFKNFLQENNVSFASFQKQIEAEIIWQKIISEVIKPSVTVSEIEIKEWLEKEKIEGQKDKFLFQDYLISDASTSPEFANKFYQELKAKKDYVKIFEKIIPIKSGNSENIGWLWSSELNPKILAKISNLKINEFSEPILLDDGWHIFKLRDKKSDLKISNKEYDFIKNQIVNRKLEVAVKNYLGELKKRAFIEYKF